MREQRVVVAVVQDGDGRFLVTYNAKWNGYAFPMIDARDDADLLGASAVRALEHDLGCQLPRARAVELEYFSQFGISGRTGEETQYEYWLFAVEPGQTLDLAAAPNWNNNPPMFLTFDDLSRRTDLTTSTSSLVRDVVEAQAAVLAIITRAGERETEFLVVWNDNYGGYFFPVQRLKSETKPERVARATVRSDLGYRGPATATWLGEVPDVHFSQRFQHDRRYRFHLCNVRLAEVDLHQPHGPLEQALTRRGKKFLWLPGSSLLDNPSTLTFSPTLAAVRQSVLGAVPAWILPEPLRRSEGGLALIEQTVNGRKQWLAQWNQNWGAFFLVGGHRQDGESFRDCVIREIEEELGLAASDFRVDSAPAHHLEYRALSGSAGELTDYTLELFETHLTAAALDGVRDDPMNKWLTEDEIHQLEAHDGRSISTTVLTLLLAADLSK